MSHPHAPHPHIASFAQSLIAGLDWSHPALAGVDRRQEPAALMPIIAHRLREAVAVPLAAPLHADVPANVQNRFSRRDETTGAMAERCVTEERWVSVGREYAFAGGPRYDVSPEPSLNTQGCPFGEWTWQFNRHNEWAILARLHQHSPQSRYAKAVSGWVRRWLEQCPPPAFDYSAHHASWRTIEIGIRLAQTWPHVLRAFRHSEEFDDILFLAWLGAWAEQAAFVWRYRKGANWLMMEMTGLLSAGICLPFHRDAALWRELALGVMRDEADVQFHPDGHQIELSANYHMVCVHQYQIMRKMLQSAGYAVPEWIDPLLQRTFAPMRAMARPDRYVFGFQDTTPISLPRELGGVPPELRDAHDDWFATGQGTPPAHRHDLLPYAGYVILRSGRGESDLAIVMDGGPYGAAHQHEDKLGIQLIAHGTELIGEAGLVDYSDSPERHYSLTTRAHSTAIVDGYDQNRRSGYNRDQVALDLPAGIVADLESNTPWAQATYDEGYGPGAAVRVAHTRTITLIDADTVVVRDRFSAGDGKEHTAEILFHVLVEPAEHEKDSLVTRGPAGNVAITWQRSDGGVVTSSVITGGTTPDLRGWAQRPIADVTGTWEPIPRPCLTLFAQFRNSLDFVTVLRTFAPGVHAIATPFRTEKDQIRIGDR